jgi:arylsulfatase A
MFTSDNGPAAGTAGPLRGKKGSTFEGGMREPCIVRWPSRIGAGTQTDEITSIMDLLPTLARLAGSSAPSDRIIDGHDIWPILSDQLGARSGYEALYYYSRDNLNAVRSGPHAPPQSIYSQTKPTFTATMQNVPPNSNVESNTSLPVSA